MAAESTHVGLSLDLFGAVGTGLRRLGSLSTAQEPREQRALTAADGRRVPAMVDVAAEDDGFPVSASPRPRFDLPCKISDDLESAFIVCVDREGGGVPRLGDGSPALPPAKLLASPDDARDGVPIPRSLGAVNSEPHVRSVRRARPLEGHSLV